MTEFTVGFLVACILSLLMIIGSTDRVAQVEARLATAHQICRDLGSKPESFNRRMVRCESGHEVKFTGVKNAN